MSMDDKTSSVIMNKEQLLLFMENRQNHRLAVENATISAMFADRKGKASGKVIMNEDHHLAVKNASISAMFVDQKVMVSKASDKVISNKDQQPMFSAEYILRLKNAISAAVDHIRAVSKDGVEQDLAARDGTTPSI